MRSEAERREQLLGNVAGTLVCGLALALQACSQKHEAPSQQGATMMGGANAVSSGGAGGGGASAGASSGATGAGAMQGGGAGMATSASSPAMTRADAGVSGTGGSMPPPSHAAMPVDLSGTWITEVKTLATETVPLIGQPDANLRLVARVVVTTQGGKLDAKIEMCAFSAITTPDPQTLTVQLSDAAIATLTTSASESAPSAGVGDAVPLPALTIRTGIDASGQPVDSDNDMQPGVTVAASVGILGSILGYAGVTVKAAFDVTLKDENTLAGTGQVSSNGVIFGSSNPLLPSATIAVNPKMPDVPLMLTRVPKDMPCSDVLKQFP